MPPAFRPNHYCRHHVHNIWLLLVLLVSTIISHTLSWQQALPQLHVHVEARIRPASFLPLMSSTVSSSTEQHDDDDDDIIMLSGYPFYIKGPDPKAIAQVAEKTKRDLEQACGGQLKGVDRMGSSAIDGIAGTPVCDLLIQLSPWPMSDDAKETLRKKGYEFQGNAPHFHQDEWYFGGDGKPGHLGRVVLHTVPHNCTFVRDMKAFVQYVNTHPEAFHRYNNVKVEGAILMSQSPSEDGRLLGYKGKKAKVCNEIKREAIEWWAQEEEGGKKKSQHIAY